MASDPHDDDDDDPAGASSQRWAADEETAMWDDKALHDSGYTALVDDRAAKPRAATGPATTREVGGEDKAKVKLTPAAQPAMAAPTPPAQRTLGWILTLAAAITVGAIVFFVVLRIMRG